MHNKTFRKAAVGCTLIAIAALYGCEANGPGTGIAGGGGGGGGGGVGPVAGGSTLIPNDGTTPTTVTEGGTALTGHFVCTESAQIQYGSTTTTSVNGLIGANLTPVLNMLGANTATALLNSVSNAYFAIDGNLDTFSTFALTAGALSQVDSVGQTVTLPAGATIPAGKFAVFAVQFPPGTVTAAILGNVTVRTFLGDTQQESITVTQNQLALLGTNVTGSTNAFIGVKTTRPYSSADISLTPSVLSASVGDAMHVNELCTNGNFVP